MKGFWRSSWLAVLCGLWSASAVSAEDFLDVDRAFGLRASVASDGGAVLHFELAPAYHLYKERIAVEAVPATVQLATTALPAGSMLHDDNFGRDMEVYRSPIDVPVRFESRPPAVRSARLRVSYQGCADAGLCYPPQTRDIAVKLSPTGQVVEVAAPLSSDPPEVSAPDAVAPSSAAAGSSIQSALGSGRLLRIAPVFLLAGLLLSFTPCVLPMVPILSSIIVGQGIAVSRRRGFSLALAYSLGMALVYTIFGVVAGLLGEGLAAWLQNPWVLGAFGLLLSGLALSMFGVYELQLPARLQTSVAGVSGRLKGGKHGGVFLMGGLSALIVGPCVAAPLAGALVYISQTRDVVIGAVALFSLAIGMSVPLLLVGVSAGTLLPRVGAWMVSVKTVFGVMLLAVAWWLVQPVLPAEAAMLLLALLLALCAALLGTFTLSEARAGLGHSARKAFGWVLAGAAMAQVVGALAGADNPWQPLRPLASRGEPVAAAVQAPANALSFRTITSEQALEQALSQASGRPLMLDFYADWCTSCKEMEHLTFADPGIQKRLSKAVVLQADVTANTPEQRALLKRFGLFGPPGVLFFDPQGQERIEQRVIGFENAADFARHLESLGLQ